MQKFGDLTFKGKIEHIIYYYKWHIIGSILIIAFVFNMVQSYVNKDKNAPLVTISLQGNTPGFDGTEDLENEMTKKLAQPEISNKVKINFFPMNVENHDEYSSAVLEKYLMLTAVGEIDVAVLDEDFFKEQAKIGGFIPLDSIPELSDIVDKYKDEAFKVKAEDDTKEELYGIKADHVKIFDNIGYSTEGKVIGISVNTKKLSYCIDTMKLILNE